MKLALPILFTIILAFSSEAKDAYKSVIDLYLTQKVFDNSLEQGTAVFEFNFVGLSDADSNSNVQYSIDGIVGEIALNNFKLRLETVEGAHLFQFYVNSDYEEVVSDTLWIESQFVDHYNVTPFVRMREEIITFKPVIYLYPEKTTDVSVQLDINGHSPFYYPRYENGWKVTATPDGSIVFNGEQYRYLFWEAHQDDHLASISVDQGFVVKGADAQSFLDEKLDEVGFTSEEKADFITFWGPKMAALEQSHVRFEWNESCDKFAELNITPQPDQLFRFYIFIAPAPDSFDVEPQELPTFKRSAFTVLEWGGQQSNLRLFKSL